MRRLALLACVAIALAGCGRREPLRPAAGEQLPPKPAMARQTPTAADLLTPTQQQRPERSEELLRRSEERPDDSFNLPPPG